MKIIHIKGEKSRLCLYLRDRETDEFIFNDLGTDLLLSS